MKKKVLIIILIVILLILLTGGVLAYTYFFTDIFKSSKEIFLKYISKNEEIIDILKDEDIKAYGEKQNNNPYTIKGSIKTNATFPDSSQTNLLNALQNCNITFEGNIDKTNKYDYRTIRANYSDAQSLGIELVKNNDIYAIKINEVINRFIGVENNNLKELAKKMGASDEIIGNIPDKIDLDKYKSENAINEDKLNQIAGNYSKTFIDNLKDDMFVKEDTEEGTAYIVSLDETQIANIISQTENEYINAYKDQINSFITKYKFKIEIKVYVKNQELVKTDIVLIDENSIEQVRATINKLDNGVTIEVQLLNTNQKYSITINKTKSENIIKYYFELLSENTKIIDLTMNFTGINKDEVQESAEMNLNLSSGNEMTAQTDLSNMKFLVTYNNTKTFVPTIAKSEETGNIMTINTAPSAEAIQKVFSNIVTKLQQVNSQKMTLAGINNSENPFIYYIPAVIPVGAMTLIQSTESISTPIALSTTLITSLGTTIYSNARNTINETNIGNQETNTVETFNITWETYNGRQISASSVRTLVSSVISNNSSSEHKITVNNELPQALPGLDNEKTYTITLTYDESGYVNGILYN